MTRSHVAIYSLLLFSFALYIAVWFSARDMQAGWGNVPPVPPRNGGEAMMLGDAQLSYRVSGLMLQNMGDTGGRSTSLKDYDYERLGQWFFQMDRWDSRSNFIPLLAAYYFGATPEAKDLGPIVDYLAQAGDSIEGEKWRWLAQAVFLARYRMEDLDRALALAYRLAAIDNPDMPAWPRQMPAFVMLERGDKEASYDIMMQILTGEVENLHPNEINFMRDYICTRILDKTQAAQHPLCVALP